MKVFSTTSARMYTVRKEGYYPSRKTADSLVSKIAIVLGWPESSVKRPRAAQILTGIDPGVAIYLRVGSVSECEVPVLLGDIFTGSELDCLNRLIKWWTIDDEEQRVKHCFLIVDLNTGTSLCVNSRSGKGDPRGRLTADNCA